VLEAERLGLPLSNLLGGTRTWVDVGVSLGIEASPGALADRAEREAAQGYRKIKLKIAPGSDLAYVEAVRNRLGPDASLMVDANAAYTEKDFEHLEKLDAFALSMIEQPLHSEDLRMHAQLQKRLTTPICLDESVTGPERADDMIAMESGRIINIKPGRVGGFTSSRRIHDRAAKVGMPVWCGGMLESGIGRACNVALASLPNFTMPGDLSPSRRYWEQDIVTPEWTMEPDGRVQVPTKRPGLGVEVDEDRIQGLTRSEFTLVRDR
jgi:o-succinylbenzoate synthase